MDLREVPKIDLHCHLDGSVRVSTVAEIGKQLGLALPDPIESELVAVGYGLERIAMLRYGIDDIRRIDTAP